MAKSRPINIREPKLYTNKETLNIGTQISTTPMDKELILVSKGDIPLESYNFLSTQSTYQHQDLPREYINHIKPNIHKYDLPRESLHHISTHINKLTNEHTIRHTDTIIKENLAKKACP